MVTRPEKYRNLLEEMCCTTITYRDKCILETLVCTRYVFLFFVYNRDQISMETLHSSPEGSHCPPPPPNLIFQVSLTMRICPRQTLKFQKAGAVTPWILNGRRPQYLRGFCMSG